LAQFVDHPPVGAQPIGRWSIGRERPDFGVVWSDDFDPLDGEQFAQAGCALHEAAGRVEQQLCLVAVGSADVASTPGGIGPQAVAARVIAARSVVLE